MSRRTNSASLRILLLGGTDLTVALGQWIVDTGFNLAGVVHVGRSVAISYDKRGVSNVRYADVAGWCTSGGFRNIAFTDNAAIEAFAEEVSADFLLVAGWYHMVPQSLRSLFPRGAAGLHASMLPKLRGGAPLPWAILSGADKTGVSMFALSEGIDAGDLYGQVEIPIGPRTTVTELVAAVEAASLSLVSDSLAAIAAGTLTMLPQTGTASYCLQRRPEDGRIDWRVGATDIDRLVRAVSKPYPGAFSDFDGRKLTIWRADIAPQELIIHGMPGQIARIPEERDPIVVCGSGNLIVREADLDGEDALALLRKSGHMRLHTV